MSNKQFTESEYWLKTLLVLSPFLFFLLIIFVCLLKSCIGESIDDMDNSIISSRQIVEHLDVLDSTRNGFRVVYATKNNVTDARLSEIKSREHIKSSFRKLQNDAPIHFSGSLLYTDIYDFADFAVGYDSDPDIVMHNIFVAGHKKSLLYIGNNPNIDRPAKFFDSRTEQGIQYISHGDIYCRRDMESRIYRYWKCYGNNQTSKTDERFSHFSEDDRIW